MIVRANNHNYIFRELPEWWPEVLADEDTRVTATNAQFDLTWMIDHFYKRGVVLHQIKNVRDPMILSQLANTYRTRVGAANAGNPGAFEPNDLAYMLAKYEGIEIKKAIDHDKTDWTGVWSREMVEYMLEDIEYLDPLGNTLDEEISKQEMEHVAWIEQNTIPATAWMRYNGIQADIPAWRVAQADWREHAEHLFRYHLKKMWPGVHNFNSPKQIVAASNQVLGAPLPNTKRSTLEQLAQHYESVEVLLEFRHFQTRLKMWGPSKPAKGKKKEVPGFLEQYVCVVCSRFHPDWRQIGTETARYSCSSPNLQQIPRAPEFRKLFIAPEGMALASLDYSAIEVLAAAVYAKDQNLLAACATGDPHTAVAKMIYNLGKTYDAWEELDAATKKLLRQNAKIANFGLLFGGGAAGLVIQARDLFKVHITEDEAKAMIQEYYTLFPNLRYTKNKAYREMDSHLPAIEIRNAVNFRRTLERLNRKPTSYLNSWIQSSAGHGLKSSIPYLMGAGLLPFLCLQVHDELVFEFPGDPARDDNDELIDKDLEALVYTARDCMIQGMRDVLGQDLHVNVDTKAVGSVWL